MTSAAVVSGTFARKRFGQHFLAEHVVISDIVTSITPTSHDVMVEIGPGIGALTYALLEHLRHLTVIEIDRDLAKSFKSNPKINVIEADVLKVDFSTIAQTLLRAADAPMGNSQPTQLRIVGNLPYNISSPILFHLLGVAHLVQDQHFMLQKEVVDRMVAKPCTASYGRLSVMLQWRYEISSLFHVAPQCFYPPPRVISSVVRMLPLNSPAKLDVNKLSQVVKIAFSQRRKLLRHTLGIWLDQQNCSYHFDVQRRAEEVSVDEYIKLVDQLDAR